MRHGCTKTLPSIAANNTRPSAGSVRLLHHAQFIDDRTIKTLHGLPPPLRNFCMLRALDHRDREYGFSAGLRLLASRGAASSFDALVRELASASQPEQVYAIISELVEALPLPDAFPPPQVGNAYRLDQAIAIRSRAKSWRNCLTRYLDDINAGACAIYLCEQDNIPAACLVRRYGRLGWFLEEVTRSKSFPGESCRDDGDRIGIGNPNVLKCDTAASPPQTLRGRAEERGGSPLRQSIMATPDRFLECAHGDPGRDVQRIARRGLRFENRVGQVLSSDAQDVGFVH